MIAWAARTVALGVLAMVAVIVGERMLRAVSRDRPAFQAFLSRLRWPSCSVAAVFVLRGSVGDLPANAAPASAVGHLATLAVIGTVVWWLQRAFQVMADASLGRFAITDHSRRRSRIRRTQIEVLHRLASALVVAAGFIAALRTFPWGKELGTALLAAGGITAAIVGVTGRSTLGNVIAGLQIAFAEPIQLDDVVVVNDEWGTIEEITLTYVVIRAWDERRLVLPTSYFVDTPFQNWTRRTPDLLGTVELWVDYRTDLDALRSELEQLVKTSRHWDRRLHALQVTDASPHALKIRAVVSAADSSHAWDLRCEVREGLARFLRDQHVKGIPRLRTSPVNSETGEPVVDHSPDLDDGRPNGRRERIDGAGQGDRGGPARGRARGSPHMR